VALFVVLAGAALGAGAFAAEQRLVVWDPVVDRTETGGWRISGTPGLPPTVPAIAGGHVVWGQGPYTCTLELESGETHVIGVAPAGMSVWPPAADETLAAWVEAPRNDDSQYGSQLWVYDSERGRRRAFAVGPKASAAAAAGTLVVWFEGGSETKVLSLNTADDARTPLVESGDLRPPVLAGDGHVGWLQDNGAGRGSMAVLQSLTSDSIARIPLNDVGGAGIGYVQLHGGLLLWTLQSAGVTRVMAHDTRNGVTTVVAAGTVASAATDGDMIVWAAAEDTPETWVIRGQRLGEAVARELARLPVAPSQLAVGDGWIAWAHEHEAVSSLAVEPLAQ
jgi:hypothetical protein